MTDYFKSPGEIPRGSGDFEPPPAEEMNAAIPQYEFQGVFASDRTGALYRAWQDNLDRDVCVKVLPPISADRSDEFVSAFQNEARSMARLNHPNIVKIYDFGRTESGLPWFAMEYVEGNILYRMIQNSEVAVEHVLKYIPEVCDALEYAHRNSVVHCDIRPLNILLTLEEEVKVANFGFSAIRGRTAHTTSASITSLAAVDYMAPEARLETGEIDHRADIYSVGVMIYEMLTRMVPRGAWKKASELVGTDEDFDRIIDRAMSPDPDDRYQSTGEIRSALEEIGGR